MARCESASGFPEPAPRAPGSGEFLRRRADALAVAVLGVLAPKCPLCLTVYCGAATTIGFGRSSWSEIAWWVGLTVALAAVVMRAVRRSLRRSPGPLLLAGAGTVSLIAGKAGADARAVLTLAGVGLILLASVWPTRPALRPA